jgi:AcrR family transcriptional regulator
MVTVSTFWLTRAAAALLRVVPDGPVRQDGGVSTIPGTRAKGDAYHHGDLASALTEVATDLARSGGPESVVLREAARRVGVSATAAYRHFAGQRDLVEAVKERALAGLAAAMRANVDAVEPLADPVAEGVRRLRAIGRAYIEYSMAEPGLFRTAFCPPEPDDMVDAMEEMVANSAPYRMLSAALDDLAAAGALPPDRRPFAEVHLWATVHGLAVLMLDGPLRSVPEEGRAVLITSTLDYCLGGLRIAAGSTVDGPEAAG